MVKKEIEFHEVKIRFLVRKGTYGVKSAKELREELEGFGGNIGPLIEDVEIKIDGK